MSDDSFNWIDDELRRVPLPEGLLKRLRQLGKSDPSELTDGELDQALCSISVPGHLESELLLVPGDEQLDEQLREVEAPAEFLEQLAYIPQDERLRDVVVPVEMLLELRRIPPRRRQRIPAGRLALAASLLLMITTGYVLSMAGVVMTAYDEIPEPFALISVDSTPVELSAAVAHDEAVVLEVADPQQPMEFVAVDTGFDPLREDVDTQSVWDRLAADIPDGYDYYDNCSPITREILGQPYVEDDRTPDLEIVEFLAQRGVEPPILAGFDRQFLIAKRTNPFVRIAGVDASELQRSHLPLWTGTESFQQMRRQIEQRRLPSPRQIHVEDFLAAMDYRYAKANRGQLAIRAAAGPSVFGEAGDRLLQIGVQAGLPSIYGSESTHVTLALDVSESMRWNRRLEVVQQAVQQFTRLLRPEDRISLVVFNEVAEVPLQDVPGDNSDELISTLDQLKAVRGTNALVGLQIAASLTQSDAATQCEQRHLVVVSDGMPRLRNETIEGVGALVSELQERNVSLHIVSMNTNEADSHGRDGLQQLAALAGHDVAVCADTQTLRDFLCESVLQASAVVARDANVTIEFNPDAVDRYRLFGHESINAGGTLTAALGSTILGGESSTTLYELQLKPNAPELVAVATVEWTDENGRRQTVQQEVHFRQFRNSWREMALSLQAATIAAEAAEVLRESPFCHARNRDLRDVLDQSNAVNPVLAKRDSYAQFINVLRRAEAVRRGTDVAN